MNKKKLVLLMSTILLILSVSFLFSVALKGRAESSELFEMSGSTLVRYTGDNANVTIPSKVSVIGKGAFAGNDTIEKVTISNSVQIIEYEAFNECSALLEVDIPDSVKQIGSSAFAGCEKLCDVTIGKGLETLGSGVFAGCDSLADITISPKSVTFTCVDGVLYDAERTKLYQVLAGCDKTYYIMPDSVTEIEQYAFWGNDYLKHMQISENVTEIPAFACSNSSALQTVSMSFNMEDINMKAFEDCTELLQIYIPDSVRYIHETAFDGCPKVEIFAKYYSKGATFAKANGLTWREHAKFPLNQAEIAKEEYYLMKEKEAELERIKEEQKKSEALAKSEKGLLGKTKIVGNNAVVFFNRYEAEVYAGERVDAYEKLQKSLKDGSIPDQLFYRNDELQEITIPNETVSIGKFAFARTGLQKVEIPEGVTTIGFGAFYHCEELSEVVIPDSVTFIDANAFEHTAWLETWYKEGKEEYLIVGDGVLLAYKGDAADFKKPAGVKCIACEIPTDVY